MGCPIKQAYATLNKGSRRMKRIQAWRWLPAAVLLLALAVTARAWQPAGWTYWDWPWAYESSSGDWRWFSPDGAQWIFAHPPGTGWALLPQSGIAHGWSYWDGEWVCDGDTGAWCWRNAGDTQWCVNMRTDQWSVLGQADAGVPSGMVLIPGGTNSGTDPDYGAYSLTVDSFYMDRYEVNKALWDEVRTWAAANGYTDLPAGGGKAANHPVQTVSWYDCVKWCNARSQKAGRTPVYYTDAGMTQVYKTGAVLYTCVKTSANGYRLPSEVQWEYAARGGVANRRFPWGDTDTIHHARANYYSSISYSYDTSPTRGHHPTYNDETQPYTSPVGAFAANGYGLYDMAGNVWEWCYDWYPGYEGSIRVISRRQLFLLRLLLPGWHPLLRHPGLPVQQQRLSGCAAPRSVSFDPCQGGRSRPTGRRSRTDTRQGSGKWGMGRSPIEIWLASFLVMQMAFYAIPARSDAGLREDLNRFLRSHRVLSVHREFVGQGDNAFWALAVE
jgi:formylglycine-generating enzyme required for sulfatase activity